MKTYFYIKTYLSGQISKCWKGTVLKTVLEKGYLSTDTNLSHEDSVKRAKLALSRIIRRLISQLALLELVRILIAT